MAALSDHGTLTRELCLALGRLGPFRVTIVERKRHPRAVRSLSEIVICRIDGARTRGFFVRYAGTVDHQDPGYSKGPEYEAAVYRHVLDPLGLSTQRAYSEDTNEPTSRWLVLEYVEGDRPCQVLNQTAAMATAAAWIGRFHAVNEARVETLELRFLDRTTVGDYRRWARRTFDFARTRVEPDSRLTTLSHRYDRVAELLAAQPPTVIHGDYYTDNILLRDGAGDVCPLDWEDAVVGVGFLDLASLTNGWHDEVISACEEAYLRARWPAGPPANHRVVLGAARVHLLCRLLGEAQGWPDADLWSWWLDLLRTAAADLAERWTEEFGEASTPLPRDGK